MLYSPRYYYYWMLSQIFIELPNTWTPSFIRVRRERWCANTEQYAGSLKQILFFSFFHWIFSNKHLFFPYFPTFSGINVVNKYLTLWLTFLGVCIGEGWWRWIFEVWFLLYKKNICKKMSLKTQNLKKMLSKSPASNAWDIFKIADFS